MIGFAIAFHILLPSNHTFDHPLIAFIKVLVMMTGEFDFEYNFRSQAIKDVEGSNVTDHPNAIHPVRLS